MNLYNFTSKYLSTYCVKKLRFSAAASKTAFCNLTMIANFTDKVSFGLHIISLSQLTLHLFKRNETFQSAWYDYCMKSNHPNVFICPKEDKHNVFKAPNCVRLGVGGFKCFSNFLCKWILSHKQKSGNLI